MKDITLAKNEIEEMIDYKPNEDFFLKHKHKHKKLIRFEINEKLTQKNFTKKQLLYILELLENE